MDIKQVAQDFEGLTDLALQRGLLNFNTATKMIKSVEFLKENESPQQLIERIKEEKKKEVENDKK